MDQQFVTDEASAPLATGVVYTDGQGRQKAALVIGTVSSIVLAPPAQDAAVAQSESDESDTELDLSTDEDDEPESSYDGHSHKHDLALKPGELHLSVFSPRGRRYTRYAVPFSGVGAPRTWNYFTA